MAGDRQSRVARVEQALGGGHNSIEASLHALAAEDGAGRDANARTEVQPRDPGSFETFEAFLCAEREVERAAAELNRSLGGGRTVDAPAPSPRELERLRYYYDSARRAWAACAAGEVP